MDFGQNTPTISFVYNSGILNSSNRFVSQGYKLEPINSPSSVISVYQGMANISGLNIISPTNAVLTGQTGDFSTKLKSYVVNSPSLLEPTTNTGLYHVWGLNNPLSISSPSGPAPEGSKLMFKIRGVGSYPVTFSPDFIALGASIPTGSVSGKTMTIGFMFDSFLDKWGCIAAITEI